MSPSERVIRELVYSEETRADCELMAGGCFQTHLGGRPGSMVVADDDGVELVLHEGDALRLSIRKP